MTDCTGGTVEEFSKVRKSIVAVQYFRVNRYFSITYVENSLDVLWKTVNMQLLGNTLIP